MGTLAGFCQTKSGQGKRFRFYAPFNLLVFLTKNLYFMYMSIKNTKAVNNKVVVILPDIRSTFNVGSIFRTSDSLGINEIILCGTTPAPIDRFGRERKDIAKVSLGAEKSVTWKYEENTINVIKKLKKEGYQIIAIEQSLKSIDYKKVRIKKPVVFIVGNEVDGINKNILKLVDIIAEIPMKGEKESLNVSVSFGIALYRMLNI